MEYIIVADYKSLYNDKINTCLVLLAGYDKAEAENLLEEVKAGKHDHHLGRGKNPRLETVTPEEAWWRQGRLD